MLSSQPLLDAAGRRRSPATTPGARAGIAPHNKGQTYPADPPTVDEIVAVMRQAGDDRHGHRVNALIVVLWRAGLRIQEALSLAETDLDQRRGSILVRAGLCRIRHNPRRIRIDPRRRSRSDSISDSASWMRSPPRHSTTISARSRSPCRSGEIRRMTATISSTVGGSAGYTCPLFLGACPALWPGIAAGERRLPVASSNN
jgi:integrase